MTVGMLTADWFLLGKDVYFRKFEIYSMGWSNEVNLENVVLESAPYGGPIALKRDKKKIVRVEGSSQHIISIYSGSGEKITSIKWDEKPIVKMGWSNDEKLIFILEDGNVIIFNIFTNFKHTFNIHSSLQDSKVIQAVIFTNPENFTGIAVMNRNYSIYLINNIHEPKIRTLSDLPRSPNSPSSWVVISEKQQTEVLIARQNELYRLRLDEGHPSSMLEPDISNKYTAILKMAVSINAKHIVIYTDAGFLWMGSSNLRIKYGEFDTGKNTTPNQLVWCGTEAIAAFWESDSSLLIIGRQGKKMIYTYDSIVHLSPEVDGVRIISSTQHELLQKVPDVVQKIFRINSVDPGSFLLEASKQFQKRSHKADEYISLVKHDLSKAVKQCIEAAGYEFDPDVQKMLIRGAQFGKCFTSDIDSDKYVNMCRLLRVLNAVRDKQIGIPLTFTQLECLTYKTLLDRLVARRQYYLAIQIAKYLKLPNNEGSNRILVDWAKYKVSKPQPADDDVIAKEIVEKLGYGSGISYSEIARTASDNGRKKLAIKLLDYETKASKQVDLLVVLKEQEPALVKAIESGDTDLMYNVILKLRNFMPLADFKMLIHKYPTSKALYLQFCRENCSEALKEIYIQEDNFNSQAQYSLLYGLDTKKELKFYEIESAIASAADAFKKGRNDLNASICEESHRLLKYQKGLQEKLKLDVIGKSVHETCKQLLIKKDIKMAEKFKAEYKIPDKRFCWLRIQTLAELDEWEELERFSKMKKPPIGFAPFVDVCLNHKKIREAVKYLPRVSEEIKVKYYVKANELEEAAQIAYEQRNVEALISVQSRCPNNSLLSEKISSFITLLGPRK